MYDTLYPFFINFISAHADLVNFLLLFTPFVLFLEVPMILLVAFGIVVWSKKQRLLPSKPKQIPKVTCVLLCYSEGAEVANPIRSLAYQLYPGEIEIIAVIDGAIQNKETYKIAKSYQDIVNKLPNRELIIVPKWQRGGRVSSMNLGISMATGSIFMALDGDTSFDNNMVINAVRNFDDSNVVAVAGNLRVRNDKASLATRLQSLEYILSIGAGRTGLSSFNIVNNISGAFGIFRIEILKLVMGWDTGTAEDFDITMRIKEHFASHPNWRIVFDPHVIGHTEVPGTFFGFFQQRIRWEGDLFYIIGRKYLNNIRPQLLGRMNYLFSIVAIYFFQIVMPFIITIYTLLIIFFFPLDYIITISIVVYLFYLTILYMFFTLYLLLISERVKEDFIYYFYLPLFPLFTFAARINAALALLHSIINKSHLDSNMAPWWVLKKGKY